MDWGDGGGFMNDSITEEPHQVVGSVSVASGDEKNKAIAAVSVSQIAKLTRPNEGLVIHGRKIYHVNLVAKVYEIIDINPQKIHVTVDDYTSGGPLEVSHIIGDTGTPDEDPSLSMFNEQQYNDNDQGEQPRSLLEIRQGDYIRCIGVVKFSQDKANLVAYNLKIIDDPNEVTVHHLEVIRDSIYYQKLQTGNMSKPREDKAGMGNKQHQQQQQDHSFGRLSTRDKHLMKFLKEQAPEEGIRFDDIAAKFKAFSRSEIAESLNSLTAEGLCWQGDSEDLWCVATSDP